MAARDKRFTIYDMMEHKGIFEANVANQHSPEYAGPQEYPKMMYHPEGETRITVPAEIIVTPFGPKAVNEQREIVSQIVSTPAEEKKLSALGWHAHPALAIAAGGGEAPAMSSGHQIARLEKQLADAQAALAKAKGPDSALRPTLGVARVTTKPEGNPAP